MKKYKILHGQHSDKAPDGSRRIYKGVNGDVIESKVDLCERFNVKGYEPRFIEVANSEESKFTSTLAKNRVIDGGDTVAVLDPPVEAKVEEPSLREQLEDMHHKKLNKWAEENEYDIEGLTSNEEKINAIIAQADLR